jgi:hypothetical protein
LVQGVPYPAKQTLAYRLAVHGMQFIFSRGQYLVKVALENYRRNISGRTQETV